MATGAAVRSSALLLTAVLAVPAGALTSGITPEIDTLVRKGIDGIYSMDFDAAQRDFTALKAVNPALPYGDFGQAAVGWARYVYESEMGDDSLLKPFDESVRRTVDTSKAWLALHPDDADVMVTLGAAEGIQGRLQVTRRQYLRAYMSGRSSMKAVRAAVKLNPQLYDAYLGLGMYDYYTDLYPRMIRALAKVILGGNRERGIHQLRLAAEKGRWMSVAAKMILVEIYTHDPYGARDGAAASAFMEEIRGRYPRSAMLHSAQLIALYEAGRLEEFHKGAAEFVKKAQRGEYRKADLPKGWVLMGTSLWAQQKPQEAYEAFLKSADAVPVNRWGVWGMIRAGNVLDLLGRRAEALQAYARAAAAPDRWGYLELAKAGAKRPFRLEGSLPVDPP